MDCGALLFVFAIIDGKDTKHEPAASSRAPTNSLGLVNAHADNGKYVSNVGRMIHK